MRSIKNITHIRDLKRGVYQGDLWHKPSHLGRRRHTTRLRIYHTIDFNKRGLGIKKKTLGRLELKGERRSDVAIGRQNIETETGGKRVCRSGRFVFFPGVVSQTPLYGQKTPFVPVRTKGFYDPFIAKDSLCHPPKENQKSEGEEGCPSQSGGGGGLAP